MQRSRKDQGEYVEKGAEGKPAPAESPESGHGAGDHKTGDNDQRRQRRNQQRNNRGPRNNSEYQVKKEGGDQEADASPEGKDQKEHKPKRQQRPKPDDSWRDELKKSMTVDTKIPAYPTKEELLPRPDQHQLYNNLNNLDDQIYDLEEQLKQHKDERKIIKNKIRNQNKVEYDALSKLITEVKAVNAKHDAVNSDFELSKKERDLLEGKIKALEKKAYNGRIVPEAKLKEIIAETESEYRNNKHTSTEEKRYIEEIQKLKASMPLAAEAAAIRAQINANRDKSKKIYDELKKLRDQRKEISEKIQIVRDKLNVQKETENKKSPEERQAEKEKRKKEYVESAEELAIRAKEAAIIEKIKETRKKKQEARDLHDKAWDAYNAQKLEMDKIEYMWDVMDVLKEEERKKKAAEELQKRKADELKRLKAEIATKYSYELEILGSLGSFLEQVKYERKMRAQPVGSQGTLSHEPKLDEAVLAKEKLVVVKAKKAMLETGGGVQPGQKKQVKKQKVAQPAEETKAENDEFRIDPRNAENFALIKIEPPKSFDDFDRVAQLVAEKREEYLKKRQEEADNFDKNPPEVDLNRLDREDDRKRGGFGRGDRDDRRGPRNDRGDRRGPREDNRGPRGPRRQNEDADKVEPDQKVHEEHHEKKQSKKVEYSEALFPSIN